MVPDKRQQKMSRHVPLREIGGFELVIYICLSQELVQIKKKYTEIAKNTGIAGNTNIARPD